jgi:dipeptidyl aminopeptidase/acylaminoacyl peptidase
MRRLFPVFLVLITFTFPAVAQAKHPFTFEDMMKLKRVGEPEVSPDGKWVIFSVVDVDLEANTKTPHIWIVPLTGGQEREIIADQDADRPRWAPDGKRFAFISTKERGSQVWIAEFDDAAGTVTATHKVTDIVTEAGGELWSPDGEKILFTSDVYPNCTLDDRGEAMCNKVTLDDAQNGKVKAQIFDHLLYRHWNAYKEGRRSHIFVVSTKLPATTHAVVVSPDSKRRPLSFEISSTPLDLTPGDYDAPVFSLGGQDNYAFSPDGQEICYTSNHDKNPAASTNNDLWIVPVNVGTGGSPVQALAQTKNITADNPASDSTPLYSPDGRYIAYRAQQRPGYESDRFRLMLYDRKTGEKKNLTEDFDRWVGTFTWAPDSSKILFAAEDKGEQPIFVLDVYPNKSSAKGYASCDLCEGPIHLVTLEPGYNDDIAVAPGGIVVYTKMTAMEPNEVWAYEPFAMHVDATTGKKERVSASRALTNFNKAVPGYLPESFWFPGAKNDKVQGFLIKPPNFDGSKKYPVKFLIHGGPQGAWGDDWSYRWNAELFAAPTSGSSNSTTSSGYVVIMINFHGSTGYGQKFIDAINGDWGGAPFEDLMKGLDYAEKTYPFIDKNRECALGASYGGYMANWILGHTDRFKCIVSHDGMFNAESAWGSTEELWFNDWEFKGTPYDNRASYVKWSPHQYAKNFKTPTLVIHGQRDYRLDVSEGFQLFTTLQMEGVPSKMLYFPDEGHWVLKPQNSKLWYETVNAWVDRWTK